MASDVHCNQGLLESYRKIQRNDDESDPKIQVESVLVLSSDENSKEFSSDEESSNEEADESNENIIKSLREGISNPNVAKTKGRSPKGKRVKNFVESNIIKT